MKAKPQAPVRFSLLVFLALVAILAVLAGMLLPALSKAKGRAHRSLHLETYTASSAPSGLNTESYDRIVDNPFLATKESPLSTFSIDVDTASYANMRRFLTEGQLPPKDAIRIEELLNYFTYNYPEPKDEHPFSVSLSSTECPWAVKHRLVRVGLRARTVTPERRPVCNLVFLIDVSGSMQDTNKLPLLQRSLEMLVQNLAPTDRVAIVVYAGNAGLVLDSTACINKKKILKAIRKLRAGGSTNGGGGIELAYSTAKDHFIKGGVNRVILCTDGDFNVGVTSTGDLVRLITDKARSGIYLTVLGFGMGNYKDGTLEKLADLGNGNYGYIDNETEARKLLVEQANGTMITVAKDVKIQVEFNPGKVSAYRLIGYENRLLRQEEFNNDARDAGEIGSGHTVTALYEIVPSDQAIDLPKTDALKYQPATQTVSSSPELLTIKLRYKMPEGDMSHLMSVPFEEGPELSEMAAKDLSFMAAVASFGMLLRDSDHKGNASFKSVLSAATLGNDGSEYREEFLKLVSVAEDLMSRDASR